MELIVVIVILAILAAILVPALLGYIDRAKKSDILLRAKSAMTGVQSGLTEAYAKGIPQNQAVVSDEVKNAIYVTAETDQNAHIEIVVGKGKWNSQTASTDRSATSGNHKLYTVCGFCYSESTSTNWMDDASTVFYVYDETTGAGSWDATKEEYQKCKDKGYSFSFYRPFG